MVSSSRRYRLLAIHAHPDDEASKGAATLAMYAALGHEVMVLTCTGGERGDILNPAMDKPGVLDNISAVRKKEMAESMRVLGTQHRWLGFVDSGLPQGDPLPPLPEGCFALADISEVMRDVVAVIRDFRPHVVVTYDENGGYPHPDHLRVHDISMRAWDLSGDSTYAPELGVPWDIQKMYYIHGFVRQRLEIFHRMYVEAGKPSPYESFLTRWKEHDGDIMARVTTQIRCAEFFPQRDAALRAHATQIDPAGMFFATPTEVQQAVWPTEEYELAKTRVTTDLPEDDLFAGLESLDADA